LKNKPPSQLGSTRSGFADLGSKPEKIGFDENS